MKKTRIITQGLVGAQRRRLRRNSWSSAKAHVRRGGKANPDHAARGKRVTLRAVAPENLDIYASADRDDSLAFLSDIHNATGRDGVRLMVDLRPLRTIYPGGAVLLLAAVQRAKTLSSAQPGGWRAKHPVIDQVMQQIGIYRELAIQCEVTPDHEMVRDWRSATGTVADGRLGGSILSEYEGRLADGLTNGLYDGFVEAATNTVQHGYLHKLGQSLSHGIGKRWWMLSQEKNGTLSIAICDLGIGIPASLPRSQSFGPGAVNRVKSMLGFTGDDGSMIELAIELGRTRTGEKGRGKGLSEIVDAVHLSDEGSVLICSNRGSFTMNGKKSYARTHARSIRGTLIHWIVPIAEAA